MRNSTLLIIFMGTLSLALAGLAVVHPLSTRRLDRIRFQINGDLVRELGLTDLCLFTEASYTRHISLADYHTPHQDHPLSMEHFPSGALVRPPKHILPFSENSHQTAPADGQP